VGKESGNFIKETVRILKEYKNGNLI